MCLLLAGWLCEVLLVPAPPACPAPPAAQRQRTRACVAKSMMRAARGAAGQPVLQRQLGRQDSACGVVGAGWSCQVQAVCQRLPCTPADPPAVPAPPASPATSASVRSTSVRLRVASPNPMRRMRWSSERVGGDSLGGLRAVQGGKGIGSAGSPVTKLTQGPRKESVYEIGSVHQQQQVARWQRWRHVHLRGAAAAAAVGWAGRHHTAW